MKKVAVLLLTGATMVATSANAGLFNKDVKEVTEDGVHAFKAFKPAGVRAEIGTQGYGGALVYSANPTVDVEAGFAAAQKITPLKDKEIGDFLGDGFNDTKASVSFEPKKNAYLNAKLRPFKNSFHVTTGILWQDNDLVATMDQGTVKLNNTVYKTESIGKIKAKVDFKNEVAPYLGIGFSPSITKRWGIFGEVGAAYIGSYDVNVTSNKNPNDVVEAQDSQGNVYKLDGSNGTQRKTVGQVLNEAKNEINDKGISTGVLPVAKVGVTFRF